MDRAAVAAADDAASTSDDAFAYVARAPFEPRRFAALLRANFDVARFGDGGDDVIAGAARDEGAFEGVRAGLMTLFNLVLIVDVTQSFVKYVVLGQRDGGVAKAADASMH